MKYRLATFFASLSIVTMPVLSESLPEECKIIMPLLKEHKKTADHIRLNLLEFCKISKLVEISLPPCINSLYEQGTYQSIKLAENFEEMISQGRQIRIAANQGGSSICRP